MGFMNNVETPNDHQNTKDNDDKRLRCHSRCWWLASHTSKLSLEECHHIGYIIDHNEHLLSSIRQMEEDETQSKWPQWREGTRIHGSWNFWTPTTKKQQAQTIAQRTWSTKLRKATIVEVWTPWQLALPLEILGLGKQWFLMIVDYLSLFWH